MGGESPNDLVTHRPPKKRSFDMSAQEYNTIRHTPVIALGSIPAKQLREYLRDCQPWVREAILAARKAA